MSKLVTYSHIYFLFSFWQTYLAAFKTHMKVLRHRAWKIAGAFCASALCPTARKQAGLSLRFSALCRISEIVWNARRVWWEADSCDVFFMLPCSGFHWGSTHSFPHCSLLRAICFSFNIPALQLIWDSFTTVSWFRVPVTFQQIYNVLFFSPLQNVIFFLLNFLFPLFFSSVPSAEPSIL